MEINRGDCKLALSPCHKWEVVWHVEYSRGHLALPCISCGSVTYSLSIFLPSRIKQKDWTGFPLRCPFLLSHVTILLFDGHQNIGSSWKRILYCNGRMHKLPLGSPEKRQYPESRRRLSFTKDLKLNWNKRKCFLIFWVSLSHRRIWFWSLFTYMFTPWESDFLLLTLGPYLCT